MNFDMKLSQHLKNGVWLRLIVFGLPMLLIALFAGCIAVKSLLSPWALPALPLAAAALLPLLPGFKPKRWWPWMAGVFAAAFLLRLIFIYVWPITPLSDCKTGYDFSLQLSVNAISTWHEVFASDLYYYEVWPMHAPFMVYQALCLRLLGPGIRSIQLVNVFFSALTCVFAAMCAEGLTKSIKAGIAAGLLMAFNPTTLFMASFMVNQQVSTCFFVLFLYFIIKRPCKAGPVNYALSGLALAVGQLMRPEMYIVVIAVVCMFVYELIMNSGVTAAKIKGGAVRLLCFLGVFFAVMASANALFMGLRWVKEPITQSKLSYKLMIGLNQETEGRFKDSDYPLAANDLAVEEILDERLSGPLETAELMLKKICFQFSSYNYWWLQADEGGSLRQFVTAHIFEPLTQGYMFIVMVLAIIASVGVFRRGDRRFALLYIIYIGYVCAFALMEVQQRYAYITVPVLTVLAALAFAGKKGAGENG